MAQRLRIPSHLSTRAAFEPSTFDAERRTVEVIFTTGARGKRRSWTGPYFEELEVSEAAVNLERLNNGASVLNTHSTWDIRDVIGVVDRAWIKGKEGRALIRFSDREDVKPIARDVQTGVLRHISVGYSVERLEQIEKVDDVPVYRATRWTPVELSLVPVAFDDGAVVRGRQDPEFHEVEVHSAEQENRAMPNQTPATPVVPATAEPTSEPQARAAEPTPPATIADPTGEQRAAERERARASGIVEAVRAMRLQPEIAQRLIANGTSLEDAQAEIIRARAQADGQVTTTQHVRIEGGEDLRRAAARDGMRSALLHRANPGVFQLDEVGREFRSMSLLRMAEESLEIAGVRVRGLSPMQVAALALGLETRAGLGTSDFPILLADVAGKTLRRAYDEAPQTFSAIGRRTTLPDFKPVKRNQLGEAPQLAKVVEGAEFTRGTIGEGKEQYQLATYGKVLPITRQAVVNDDLDAFSRIPALFGRSARDLESDLAWEQITTNPVMGDGVALFHATHANLGAAAAISIASIGAGRAAMRSQKGVGKKQFINAQAKTLFVPAALETVADQFVSTNLVANAAGSVNPFSGRLQVVAEPRLDANSLISWYLGADPGAIDILEYAYLTGEEGPAVETRIGFDVDGMEIKCRHDFAAKVIDFRGLYKNPGA